MRLWVIAASKKKSSGPLSFILLGCILVAFLITSSIATTLVNDIEVTVSAWDRVVRLYDPGNTVKDAVAAAGIELGPEDLTVPSADSPVKNGMNITIEKARPVFVVNGEDRATLLTTEKKISAILARAGIEPDEDDLVVPESDQTVPDLGLVRVIGVTYATVTSDIQVPYAVERREDTSIEAGISKVYAQGKTGVSRVSYRARFEDGVEVSREEVSREQISAPTARVLLVGTLREVSRGGESIRFERALEVKSSGYCPCAKCCGPNATGFTALGLPAKEGVIAVDPDVIPLGTRVYIDGYGYALAADTGGAIKGNRIDLCFSTHEEALKWGLRNLKVYIVE